MPKIRGWKDETYLIALRGFREHCAGLGLNARLALIEAMKQFVASGQATLPAPPVDPASLIEPLDTRTPVPAKLTRAKQLLKESALSIDQIAILCGWRYSDFCHAFRRNLEITPTAYRQKHRKGAFTDERSSST